MANNKQPLKKQGFDPKNRLVELVENADVYTVSKRSVGFLQECLTIEKAEKVYNKLIVAKIKWIASTI